MKNYLRKTSLLLASLICLAVFVIPVDAGATIQIVNIDGPGEGFNDLTPATPIGGNPGTTLGEQRLFAFTYAANLWARQLDSPVTIRIQAAFNPLGAGVLGSAGTINIFRDFTPAGLYPGPQFPFTWYGGAIADKRAGFDLNPNGADINTQFNSDFNFYLGVDRNFGPGQYDLVTVLLHELGHGLGFQNFVSRTTGANQSGFTDIYSRLIFDNVVGLFWDQMTDQQRLDSFVRSGSVVWTGANVTANAPRVLSPAPEFRVLNPSNLAGSYQFGTAAFGPPIGPTVTGTLVEALPREGCTALTNPAQIAGKIAIIDRGTCAFVDKVKNAQNAGAIAVVIQNNVAGIINMGGTDPTISIPSVLILQTDGNALRAAIPNVVVEFKISDVRLAGTDSLGRVLLFAPNPIQPGSSIAHFDVSATKNLLMEPSINFDLTHNLRAPDDLTVELMRDIGWFVDSDLDGIENKLDCAPRSDLRQTVFVKGVNSGVTNTMFSTGCTISDRILKLPSRSGTQSEFIRRLTQLLDQLVSQSVINSSQRTAILNAANGIPAALSQPTRAGK
jgi:hypothetical protein